MTSNLLDLQFRDFGIYIPSKKVEENVLRLDFHVKTFFCFNKDKVIFQKEFGKVLKVYESMKDPLQATLYFRDGTVPFHFTLSTPQARQHICLIINEAITGINRHICSKEGANVKIMGWGKKHIKMKWVKRYFVLIDSRLLVYHGEVSKYVDSEEGPEKSVPRNAILLDGLEIDMVGECEIKIDAVKPVRVKFDKKDAKQWSNIMFDTVTMTRKRWQSKLDILSNQRHAREQELQVLMRKVRSEASSSESNNKPSVNISALVDKVKREVTRVFVWGTTDGFKAGKTHAAGFKLKKATQLMANDSNPLMPVDLAANDNFVIAACANDVYTWGNGSKGELGQGEEMKAIDIPTKIPFAAFKNGVKAVACGISHCLALTSKGDVFAWGLGDQGQLGLGEEVKIAYEPTHITFPRNENITALDAGSNHSAFVSAGGAAFVCGSTIAGGFEKPGDVFTPTRLQIKQNISSVACGATSTFVLSRQAHVTYGMGKLGMVTIGNSPSMIKELSGEGVTVTEMSAGGGMLLVAVVRMNMGDGNEMVSDERIVMVWGTGNLGVGKDAMCEKPEPIKSLRGEHIISVATNGEYSFAICENGKTYSWGDNLNGQILGCSLKEERHPSSGGDVPKHKVLKVIPAGECVFCLAKPKEKATRNAASRAAQVWRNKTSKSKAASANPFGPALVETEKNVKSLSIAPVPASNPFGNDLPVKSSPKKKSPSASANPFGAESTKPSSKNKSPSASANPFGAESTKPSSKNTSSTSSSNPFGFESNNPAESSNDKKNPFGCDDNDMKEKISPKAKVTKLPPKPSTPPPPKKDSNPFGDEPSLLKTSNGKGVPPIPPSKLDNFDDIEI
eukprot:TRINITY_DN29_c0_g1_i2.p1 TRINITY_DN29_c0_g1~~TRINITY_DN29_c0_g1_i2.p1  ORF type:complete len:847 (-),score=306.79 TRINITY_DN29_c0_g1_i2:228-2768(-)